MTSRLGVSGCGRLRKRHGEREERRRDERGNRVERVFRVEFLPARSRCSETPQAFLPRDVCRTEPASTRRASDRSASGSRFPARRVGGRRPTRRAADSGTALLVRWCHAHGRCGGASQQQPTCRVGAKALRLCWSGRLGTARTPLRPPRPRLRSIRSGARGWRMVLRQPGVEFMRPKTLLPLVAIVVASLTSASPSAQGQGGGRPGGPGAAAPGGPGGDGRGGPPPAVRLDTLRLPPGFQISVYAEQVPAARLMALGAKGTLFVGSFGLLTGQGNPGAVYAVRDTNADGRADEVLTIATGLNQPNGIAFHNGALYVAEMQRIIRYDGIEDRLRNPPQPAVVRDGFQPSGNHQWRYIAFGPDNKLYMALGAPCNICELERDYGTIVRMNPDGSAYEVYVRGVRNSVGLTFHPGNGQL